MEEEGQNKAWTFRPLLTARDGTEGKPERETGPEIGI